MFVKKVDFETYLAKLEKNFMGTIGKIPKVGTYKKGGVFTWELSYTGLGTSAARLLQLCAYLSNEDIPYDLLLGGKDVAGDWLSAGIPPNYEAKFVSIANFWTQDELDNAIEELLTFSFVKRKLLSGKSISMHPIIHRWARENFDANLRKEKASEAIRLVASVLETDTVERTLSYWGFERRIRSHLNMCSQHISDYFVDVEKYPLNKESYIAIRIVGEAHTYWNSYKLSIIAFETALTGLQKTVGEDHISTLNAVYSMASILDNMGEYDKALEWYLRALESYEKTLGRDHISTLDTVNNMAIVFRSKGEYDKALEWYQRALEGYEKTLGHDHISTLNTVNNMAIVFQSKGEYDKALEWYQRALDGKEKALGRDHISTLDTVNNMAIVFQSKGEYGKALEWYQRALDGQEKALGCDHISTLGTVNNMAIVFRSKGEYGKALEWYQRALDGKEKALGRDHILTLNTVYNMGVTFEEQEKYDKALDFFERALDGYRKIRPNDHEDISDAIQWVSRVKEKMGMTNRCSKATDGTGEKSSLHTGDATVNSNDGPSEEIDGTGETDGTREIPPNSTEEATLDPGSGTIRAVDGTGETPLHGTDDTTVGSSSGSKETAICTIETTTSTQKIARGTRKMELLWGKTTNRISAHFRK